MTIPFSRRGLGTRTLGTLVLGWPECHECYNIKLPRPRLPEEYAMDSQADSQQGQRQGARSYLLPLTDG